MKPLKTLERVDRTDTHWTFVYRGGWIHGHAEYKLDTSGNILDLFEIIKVDTGDFRCRRVRSVLAAKQAIGRIANGRDGKAS